MTAAQAAVVQAPKNVTAAQAALKSAQAKAATDKAAADAARFGGVAGGLFSSLQGFVSPESFALWESITVFSCTKRAAVTKSLLDRHFF